MITIPQDWILHNFVHKSLDEMTGYIQDNIFSDFEKPRIEIEKDERKKVGCVGGLKKVGKNYIPYIRLCKYTLINYAKWGFLEYKHIRKDTDIGSIEKIKTWKQSTTAVIAHEMAHVVQQTHKSFMIPELFNSYPVDTILIDEQKKFHGAEWQYFYRQLRIKFVNNREWV